jgi:hypothetical protein
VPLLSKNGSGKFGMGVSAEKGPGAGEAGQSAPVFSWSKTNGGGPSGDGPIVGMSPGRDGGSVVGVPTAPGGLVSVGVNGRALGFSSPVSVAAGTPEPEVSVTSPDPELLVPSVGWFDEGAGGANVPEGRSEFVFASDEHAIQFKALHEYTSSETDARALREICEQFAMQRELSDH